MPSLKIIDQNRSNGSHKSLFLALFILFAASTANAATILDANFDDKVLNSNIGTGGAIVGEPVSVATLVLATVAGTGIFSSYNLKINNTSTSSTRTVRFEFLNNQEIDSGELHISTRFRVNALGTYVLSIREATGSADTFSNIRLTSDGRIYLSDAGNLGLTQFGTYSANQIIELDLVYDVTVGVAGGSYSVILNGNVVLVDRPHGVTVSDGIGAILIGAEQNNPGALYLDHVRAFHNFPLLEDGFE